MRKRSERFEPHMVDVMFHNHVEDSYLMVILGASEWRNSPDRLALHWSKIEHYVGFVRYGQILETYPEAAGKSVKIELHCYKTPLDAELESYVESVNEALKPYNIPFSARVLTCEDVPLFPARSWRSLLAKPWRWLSERMAEYHARSFMKE